MTEALTPWFSEVTKPVRRGWYDAVVINLDGTINVGLMRKFWCGVAWRHTEGTASWINVCGMQCRYWRGLAQEPK